MQQLTSQKKVNLQIKTEAISNLRKLTGVGIMECKRALEECSGDVEEAQRVLRERGASIAAKRDSRETKEGVIECYVHAGGRIGSMVELNCESDFVARNQDFKNLAHDIAMQIAAMNPQYIAPDDRPAENNDEQDYSLLSQQYIKDGSITVQDLLNEAISKIGETIKIKKFVRFSIGQ